jgi:hypothetical protein
LTVLSKAYRAAVDLDAGFKLGKLKNQRQALAGLVLELTASGKTELAPDSPLSTTLPPV